MLVAFADGEAADGVAVEADLDQALGALAAQVLEGRALLDAEQRLRVARAERGLAARAPAGGQTQGLGRARLFRGPGDALVELHDDVAAEQVGLNLDGALGREHMA